ncbi:MAG: hypothetical protein HRT97_10875 [Moritella sp.]|uniref:hypothetical protein n=1 Tax=Moritella sp. TaxID=78556 RepID=UPI0025EB1F4E|nr:hypothetical protein [Moritella sp.]NQZ92828.1 hypothetical protein [Moritella sp.]
MPKRRNGQAKYSAVFCSVLGAVYAASLGTGGRRYSCAAGMIWRQPYQNPSTTIKPGAELTQRPASGVAGAEAAKWAS